MITLDLHTPEGQGIVRRLVPMCGVVIENQQLYEESGGFGALWSTTTDSDDVGRNHESLRLLMEQVAPRIAG